MSPLSGTDVMMMERRQFLKVEMSLSIVMFHIFRQRELEQVKLWRVYMILLKSETSRDNEW
jgi:hypothetical protein